MTSVFSRTGAITAQAGDYTAAQITNAPAGNVAATNVQAAIDELDSEKIDKSFITAKGSLVSGTALSTPIGVTVGADGTALIADSTTSSGLSYGVQLESRFDQPDLTVNASLAASVVNSSNYIAFAQTTANITATLPNPTVGATKHRTITLCNEGTQAIGITFVSGAGFYLTPNDVMDITWNGSRWVAANAQLAVAPSYARGIKAATQTFNAIGGNVTFDTVQASFGSDISLSSGVFTLKAGKTYRLRASINFFTNVGLMFGQHSLGST